VDKVKRMAPQNRNDTMHEIFTLWKNRKEQVRVRLSHYEGHNLLDLRVFEPDAEGKLRPSKRGVSINVQKIDELIEGLVQARDEFAKGKLL
jgi:hypothetical protein